MSLKGGLVVGQSGGCTTAMNSSLVGVVREAMRHGEIRAIYGARHGVQGLLAGQMVDLGREAPATIEGLRHTPAAALGSCRYRPSDREIGQVVQFFRAREVRYFLYIGGNDSADITHRIAQATAEMGYDMRAITVPKTIDNDLPLTDHCPGYGSIARFIAITTMEAGLETEADRRRWPIKVIEVMGRNAGWVAAASALGKSSFQDAPHLICVPERPLVADRFLAEVREVYRQLGYGVIVVAETVRDERGIPWASSLGADAFGHPRLTGAAANLCRLVAAHLGLGCRWDKPGTIQRMSMVHSSTVDLAEAYEAGASAVRYALADETDRMVTLVREPGITYRCTTGLARLEEVANLEKRLPARYLAPEASFVTDGFLAYARPLVGLPLPSFVRLADVPVSRRA